MMLGQRFRQRGAASDAAQEVGDDDAQPWPQRQVFEDGERAVERDAGFEQRGQLLGEGEEVALPDASRGGRAEPALPLRVRGDSNGIVGLAVKPLDDGARIGGFHDAVDGLTPPVGGPIHEDRHQRLRRLPA